MTTFKPGDIVRRQYGDDEIYIGTILGRDPYVGDGWRVLVDSLNEVWVWHSDHLELVTPAPSEPEYDPSEKMTMELIRRKADEARTELAEFKAKVVEVVNKRRGEELAGYEADRILMDLGLPLDDTPTPSRYRVTFEVEAKSEKEARDHALALVVDGEPIVAPLRVEKIEEES